MTHHPFTLLLTFFLLSVAAIHAEPGHQQAPANRPSSTINHQAPTANRQPPDIWPVLEKLEDLRLLFHTAMWQVHEARALALEAEPVTEEHSPQPVKMEGGDYTPMQTSYQRFRLPGSLLEMDDLTREGLWLYEKIMSLDESGESLCSYRDSGRAPYLVEDLWMLENQEARLAPEVLAYYQKTLQAREAQRKALLAALGTETPQVAQREGIPWPGPEREWGRRSGISIGWPMLMQPYEDSAEALLNKAHGITNTYLLSKARKVGVGHIFVLDPDAASWRGCEPEENSFDFGRLDQILGEIKAAGLKAEIFVPSLTTGCPGWFQPLPGTEKSLVGSDGAPRSGAGVFADVRRSRDEFSMYQDKGRDKADESVNLYNPAVRAAFEKYLHRLGQHLQQNWQDTLLGVQLETNFVYFVTHTKDGLSTDIDYSRFARQNWQQWLQARYAALPALNTAWGSTYTAWESIPLVQPVNTVQIQVAPHGVFTPASLSPESRDYIAKLGPRHWNDFLDWREDYVANYFQIQADVLHTELPGLPVSMDLEDLDGHIPLLRRPVFSWNGAKMARQFVDLPQDMSSAEWAHHLLRAYARLRSPDSPSWIACQGEKTFGSLITHSITSPYYKDAIVLNHRFGPGEVLRYFHDIGAYNYMDQQLNVDGANSWFHAMREDHAVAPEILNTRVAQGQAAVLWPDSSFRWDPDCLALREAECWADALHCVGYSYDYLLEPQLTTAGLKGYQVLVLPAAWCLDEQAAAVIRQFVEGGGTLIATSAPGIRDSLGQLYQQWPLADLLGVSHPQFRPITPVVGTPLGIVQPEGWWEMDNLRQSEGDLTYAGRLCCTYDLAAAERPGFQVQGHYPDGRPAILYHKVGAGQTLLMGYPFGSEYGWSNYNEIGFGKIHGDTAELRWQRQLEAWLREKLHSLGLQPVHEAVVAVTLRPNGRESEGPTLGYPQGGSTWENYMYNVDEYDRTIEFTLREREGVPTRYLCVWNRESQYGASRGYVHHFAAPKYLTIRVSLPGIQSVYDLSLQAPVRFTRQGNSILFRTSLASCMGRVFALSTSREVVLFRGSRSAGISDEELMAKARATAAPSPPVPVLVLHQPEIKSYLASLRGKTIHISCGSPAYLELGEQLADALKKRLGCAAETTLAGVQYSAERWRHRFPGYTVEDSPEILLGNEWDSQALAYFSAAPWANGKPQSLFLPLIVNKALPGAGRGVLELSRPYQVIDRRQRPPEQPAFYRFDPAPQHLVIGGSDVEGTALALRACLRLIGRG